jgi:mono/diheme cytochrome c family protein
MKSALSRFHEIAAPAFKAGAAFVFATVVFGVSLTACKKEESTDPAKALADKGRTLYSLRCASCHNPADPTKDGALGPAIAGSSRELLDVRLNQGGYPAGYKPKRETKLMQRLPHTPEELDALHAYLNSL